MVAYMKTRKNSESKNELKDSDKSSIAYRINGINLIRIKVKGGFILKNLKTASSN